MIFCETFCLNNILRKCRNKIILHYWLLFVYENYRKKAQYSLYIFLLLIQKMSWKSKLEKNFFFKSHVFIRNIYGNYKYKDFWLILGPLNFVNIVILFNKSSPILHDSVIYSDLWFCTCIWFVWHKWKHCIWPVVVYFWKADQHSTAVDRFYFIL